MKLLFPFMLSALALSAQTPTITWTQIQTSGGSGWTKPVVDPVGNGIIVRKNNSGSSIFATDTFSVSHSGTYTDIVGTGQLADTCPADIPYAPGGGTYTGSAANRPGDRHPVGQQTYDSNRHFYWTWGGIINDCADYTVTVSGSSTTGTITSASPIPTDTSWNGMKVYIPGSANCPVIGTPCTINSVNTGAGTVAFASTPGAVTSAHMYWVDPGNGATGVRIDMWYMLLNASPASNVYARVFPVDYPTTLSSGSDGTQGNTAYDSFDDLLLHVENGHSWHYLSTIPFGGGAPTGTLSAAQTAAGYSSGADDWATDPNAEPGGYVFVGLVFDTVRHIFWMYVGSSGAPVLYAYNPSAAGPRFGIAANSWKQFCLSCTMPPQEQQSSVNGSEWNALAWNSARNTVMYHYGVNTSGVGAPADYEYAPLTDTITLLTNVGGGPSGYNGSVYNGTSIDYDASTNSLYSYDIGGLWRGQITGTLSTSLTIQEALFAGDFTGTSMSANVLSYGGIARTNEPWCMGIPIADSAAITSTNFLTLSGQSIGQFRILARWPDGNAEWIKACGSAPSLSAGAAISTTLSNTGSLNTSVGTDSLPNPAGGSPVSDTTGYGYGAANMATDNGSTITVSTNGGTCGAGSAICFTIKKANFNGIDIATVGSTSLISTSTSATRGLVLTGPPATGTSTVITGTVAGPYTISGSNNTLIIGALGSNPTTVTLTSGSGVAASTIAGEISVSGIAASAVGGAIALTANTTGRTGGIQIYAANGNSTFGLPVGSFSGAVSCDANAGGSACTTIYSSANDPSSTCRVEENGPLLAVIACQGTHKDGSSNAYMQFTARQYFYQGKSDVKMTVTLRNANWSVAASPSADCNYNSGTTQCNGGSFDSAGKGIRSYELRLGTALSGTLTYTLATDTSPQTGSLSSSDTAFIYQGQSNWFVPGAAPDTTYCGPGTSYCSNKYTTDTGYVAKKNSTTLASGSASTTPVGWFDCTDSGSNGLEIGVEEFGAQWPVSLECFATGSELRVGLFSAQNSGNVYMPWPMWRIFGDVYLNFHVGALSSQQNEYLKQQHFLIARPSITYLNSTQVWPYPLIGGTTEDTFYLAGYTSASPATLPLSNFCYQGNSTNCTPDRGVTYQSLNTNAIGLGDYRYYAWSSGGSLNQEDYRWFDLMKFIQRGYSGRFLNTRYFMRYLAQFHWGHADGTSATDNTINGFTWRSRPVPEIEQVIGSPESMISADPATSQITRQTNSTFEFGLSASLVPQWQDYLHEHSYGMAEYYFNTGDESIKEAVVPVKDYFLNTITAAYGTSPTATTGITRAYGVWLLGTARWSLYSAAIGASSDSTAFLASGEHQFDNYVNLQSCEGGIRPGGSYATYYPAGCQSADASNASVGGGDAYGTVTASGTSVTLVSGINFNPGITSAPGTIAFWPKGSNIVIGGNTYQINNVSSYQPTTSSTSLTIAGGSTSFTVPSGLGYIAGIQMIAISASTGDYMSGLVTSYSGTTLVINVTATAGSGTLNDWAIKVQGVNTLTTLTNVTGCSSPCAYSYGGGAGGGAVAGMSLERGNHQANAAGGGYCQWNDGTDSGMVGGNYRIQQPFQQAILMDGLIEYKHAAGPTWSNYNRASDLAYGMSLNNTLESFNDDGSSNWSASSGWYNGMAYFRPMDFPSQCPPGTVNTDGLLISHGGNLYDNSTTPNGDQNLYPTFLAPTEALGVPVDQRKFIITFQRGSTALSAWLGDWGMPLLSTVVYNINNPPTVTLQPVSFTCLNCSGSTTNYQLQFTTPAGTCTNDPGCLRVKWATRIIQPFNQLLGFDPQSTFTFTTDPNTNIPWFGANNAEITGTVPTATPTVAQTVTVVTATTGLTAANFAVHAMSPSGCSITPTTLGPYTNTQVLSGVTLTAVDCGSGTLTWTSSGLPAGASGCNSVTGTTCTISGTLSASGTFSTAISVTDGGSNSASWPGTSIIVNAVPTCCSPSSPLTTGTQGVAYSNSVSGSSGTLPLTYAITSGSICSGAITLSSGGTLSGTCNTPSTYSFTTTATDANGIASSGMPYSLTINASGGSSGGSVLTGATTLKGAVVVH